MAKRDRVTGRGLALAVALLLLGGCGTKTTDYRAVWSSTPTAPTTTTSAVPFSEYLTRQGVDAVPLTPQTLTELTVSMPRPPGWVAVTDPSQGGAFQVIRSTGAQAFQPTAVIFVGKLTGNNFDAIEALKHAYDLPGADMKPFNGMPSALIEATYPDVNGQRVHRYNRMVIATGKPPGNQRYLIQFSVTTAADEAEVQDPDVLTIIKGFTIAVR